MPWTDEEIDALLAAYLDQELPTAEVSHVEQLLADRQDLAAKLDSWRRNQASLRATAASSHLPTSVADRVIAEARRKVTESSDPKLAPWIPRDAPAVEPASRRTRRDAGDSVSPGHRSHYRAWLAAAATLASAACLFIALNWNPAPKSLPQFIAGSEKSSQTELKNPNSSVVVEPDSQVSKVDSTRVAISSLPSGPTVDDDTWQSPNEAPRSSTAMLADSKSMDEQSKGDKGQSLVQSGSTKATSLDPSMVAPSLQPTPEQLKMLEALSPTAPGAFVMVIDISLPPGVEDLQPLQAVLNRHDIPWSSQLDVDDQLRNKLVESRMVSEAVKRGLLPEDARREMGDASQVKDNEQVSFVFVKGRGNRMDQTLVELMRRVEEFPEFSFDLAFDPPIRSLVDELRFIQEASLPSVENEASLASLVRVRTATEAGVVSSFVAAPRRTPAMSRQVRRQSSDLSGVASMNPITYALIVVRRSPAAE